MKPIIVHSFLKGPAQFMGKIMPQFEVKAGLTDRIRNEYTKTGSFHSNFQMQFFRSREISFRPNCESDGRTIHTHTPYWRLSVSTNYNLHIFRCILLNTYLFNFWLTHTFLFHFSFFLYCEIAFVLFHHTYNTHIHTISNNCIVIKMFKKKQKLIIEHKRSYGFIHQRDTKVSDIC